MTTKATRTRTPTPPRVPVKRDPTSLVRKVPRAVQRKVLRTVIGHQAMNSTAPAGMFNATPATISTPLRLGVIVDAGPEGEVDYTDHRYWVALAWCVNPDSDLTAAMEVEQVFEEALAHTITATNLVESESETHGLALGTPVWIHPFYDETANARYCFTVAGAAQRVKQFRVVRYGTDGDTLFCRAWDGREESGEGELVLLPHELRRSRYHGKSEQLYNAVSQQYVTVSYVAGSHFLTRFAFIDAESYQEQQIMVPQYVDGGHGGSMGPTIVTAVSRASVAGGLGQLPDTPEESRIEWMAQDARAWAEVFTQQTGAGIVQRMIERRGGGEGV